MRSIEGVWGHVPSGCGQRPRKQLLKVRCPARTALKGLVPTLIKIAHSAGMRIVAYGLDFPSSPAGGTRAGFVRSSVLLRPAKKDGGTQGKLR